MANAAQLGPDLVYEAGDVAVVFDVDDEGGGGAAEVEVEEVDGVGGGIVVLASGGPGFAKRTPQLLASDEPLAQIGGVLAPIDEVDALAPAVKLPAAGAYAVAENRGERVRSVDVHQVFIPVEVEGWRKIESIKESVVDEEAGEAQGDLYGDEADHIGVDESAAKIVRLRSYQVMEGFVDTRFHQRIRVDGDGAKQQLGFMINSAAKVSRSVGNVGSKKLELGAPYGDGNHGEQQCREGYEVVELVDGDELVKPRGPLWGCADLVPGFPMGDASEASCSVGLFVGDNVEPEGGPYGDDGDIGYSDGAAGILRTRNTTNLPCNVGNQLQTSPINGGSIDPETGPLSPFRVPKTGLTQVALRLYSDSSRFVFGSTPDLIPDPLQPRKQPYQVTSDPEGPDSRAGGVRGVDRDLAQNPYLGIYGPRGLIRRLGHSVFDFGHGDLKGRVDGGGDLEVGDGAVNLKVDDSYGDGDPKVGEVVVDLEVDDGGSDPKVDASSLASSPGGTLEPYCLGHQMQGSAFRT
ncbi:hypothetical protein BDK51DRAFT_38770 [Blyttiomyces helicus]|uniref:Uncharacterized protein n=1 Tax=Blyttiomyces helicus TaxID=388810 RepID=A0A4P9WCL4_9FUNG|nr:hypothetical protein BDK51DRAFT_38770 [Blyttiomyces helicus]|eukprot:RKO89395.1 hypothetical protein BDK51DRAFT_38770 [Blyttiomyces helicus]